MSTDQTNITDEIQITDEIPSNTVDLWNTAGAGAEMELSPPSEPNTPPLEPSPTDRDPTTGRFMQGNRLGRGNPVARQASRLRKALYAAVSPADLREVVQALVMQAKGGDVAAAKVLVQTLLGPPQSLDVLAVVAKLENVVFRGVQT